jgi:hypothetical protein
LRSLTRKRPKPCHAAEVGAQLWCNCNTLSILTRRHIAGRIVCSHGPDKDTGPYHEHRLGAPAGSILAQRTNKRQGKLGALALFEIGGTRCVISLVGALRPDNRLIFTFTLTTRRCRASGRKRCGFNVHTAELNTKQWWRGLRRGCSRMNPQRAAQGISAPCGSRGEGKLTEGIMPSLSCRADTRPSDTKIRPVRGALRAIVGRCAHISQNVARN